MWSEAWYWNDAGYVDLFGPQVGYDEGDMRKMPPNMWNQMCPSRASDTGLRAS